MINIFTVEQIIHYDNSYYLKDGILYDSEYDKVILNKETILKYKSSQLLLNVAKSLEISDSNKENKPFNYYIEKAMKLYSANGEVLENSNINRIINSLMNNDKSYEEESKEEIIDIYKRFSSSDYF